MRRLVVLLASAALAVLVASGAALAQTSPTITWTQLPGRDVGGGLRVTNDTTPTLAWESAGANPRCNLFLRLSEAEAPMIDYWNPCQSPLTVGNITAGGGGIPPEDSARSYVNWNPSTGEYTLKDGPYEFYYADDSANDQAFFEVDTVVPHFVSGKPTGRRVARGADVVATFDDNVYDSAGFVDIYKRGARASLEVARQTLGTRIVLDPKNRLKGDTRYTVKVTTGVNDGANSLETPSSWSFKTKG